MRTAHTILPATAIPALRRLPPLTWVLIGGLVAGSLDLLFAAVWWAPAGVSPGRILQAIAAWTIGREAAYAGGAASQLLGAGLHYGLMMLTVGGYCLLRWRWPGLRRHPLVAGAGYGAIAYVLVHLLAVPLLSAAPPLHFRPGWMLACLFVYMLLVGVPAAWFAERWWQAVKAHRH